MNISKEKVDDLNVCIKIDVEENDYSERVKKQLKDYQRRANVPGFRKGMAPMSMIQRLYKSAVVSDEVQSLLGESLYKYLEDEKMNIIGSPLSNDEKTGEIDFANNTSYSFYFDVALSPEINIDWSKLEVPLYQVKVSDKDVENQINEIAQRFGNFETPEVIEKGDHVYGKAVELDSEGNVKEGGVSTFVSFDTASAKDPSIFVGKKAEDKIVFNAFKAFTATEIEKIFRLETAASKKFKSDVELTVSGASRITPHEINEELFAKVFPNDEVKTEADFKENVSKHISEANDEQCQILFVNKVREALMQQFDATLPEEFLKRWILSRGNDKNLTAEKLEAEWDSNYIPSLKWELLSAELNKIQSIEPSSNEVVDYIKDILRKNDSPLEGEDQNAKEERLEQAARSIASNRENVSGIFDRIYVNKTFALFKDKLNPSVEKVSAKEFAEKVK